MSPHNFRSSLTTRSWLVASAVTVLALAAVVTLYASGNAGWPRSKTTSASPVESKHVVQFAPTTKVVASQGSSTAAETVTLTLHGFEPNEIAPAEGKFLLGVNNQTRLQSVSFEVLRENGNKAHQLKMTNGQLRLRKLLNFPAGRYTLREVDHPEWTCSIVISQ